MGFKSSFQILASVLLLGGIALATTDQSSRIAITVFVNNSAKVSSFVLGESEAEARRIFAAAGIEVRWVYCQDQQLVQDLCSRVPAVNEFVIHLVPTGSSSDDSVFGMAFVGQNGTGKYCDIFFDRVKQATDNVPSVAELMGTVMAHELGHLLLGSHSHSQAGLMRSVWDVQCLKGVGMGKFLFTPHQSFLIKERYRAMAGSQPKQSSQGN